MNYRRCSKYYLKVKVNGVKDWLGRSEMLDWKFKIQQNVQLLEAQYTQKNKYYWKDWRPSMYNNKVENINRGCFKSIKKVGPKIASCK